MSWLRQGEEVRLLALVKGTRHLSPSISHISMTIQPQRSSLVLPVDWTIRRPILEMYLIFLVPEIYASAYMATTKFRVAVM